jgi:phage-related protein
MKSIYIDSTQIHDYASVSNSIFTKIDIAGLEMPEIRLSSYEKAGEFGAFISNQLYGGRLITIEGGIYSTTQSTFESKRRALIDAIKISKDSDSVPEAKILKFTTLDDLELQCNVFLRKFKMNKQKYCYADFMIEFYCPDIALEDQTASSSGLSTLASGGVIYPIIYPVIYGSSAAGTQTITNNGTSEAWPVITITGVITDPIITNTTTGKYMSLDITVGSGDTLVIDMKNKTIVLNGTTNSLSTKALASEWWWLEPGDNEVTLATGSGGDDGNVTIAYRDSYLGV